MEAAVAGGIEQIVGECGGNLMCATCHVYVDGDWFERTGRPDEEESEMLLAADQKLTETSRLSCQIVVSQDLDGLIVHLPSLS
jgi:ferredoxin, 2Fe-2S